MFDEKGSGGPRAFHSRPLPAVQLQRLKEPPVLLLRPALPGLGDGVRLARLGAAASESQDPEGA
jgi:hypothetical protein